MSLVTLLRVLVRKGTKSLVEMGSSEAENVGPASTEDVKRSCCEGRGGMEQWLQV